VRDVDRGRLTPAWPSKIWQIQPAGRPNVLPDPARRTPKRIKEATRLGRGCWISNPLTGRAGSSMDLWHVGSAEASPAGPVSGNAAAGRPIAAE
jgi:hypothetical protein